VVYFECIHLAAGSRNHSMFDCFVLVVMSHGDENNVLFGKDGRPFSLTAVMEPIKKCRSLAGKPKICIIQVSSPTQVCYFEGPLF